MLKLVCPEGTVLRKSDPGSTPTRDPLMSPTGEAPPATPGSTPSEGERESPVAAAQPAPGDKSPRGLVPLSYRRQQKLGRSK